MVHSGRYEEMLGESLKALNAFTERFPPDMREVAIGLAKGQVLTFEAFAENEELMTSQHPIFAASTPSSASGHERYFVGDSKAGMTLVLRSPDAIWLDSKGELTPKTKAFFDLVGHKHIPFIVHAKGGNSELVSMAYEYWNSNGKAQLDSDPAIAEHLLGRKELYNTVKKNGLGTYKNYGVELTGNFDEQFKQAMVVQQLLWDGEKAPKSDGMPKPVLVYQDEMNGCHYVWVASNNKFLKLSEGFEAGSNPIILEHLVNICPMSSEGEQKKAAHELMEGLVKGLETYAQVQATRLCIIEFANGSGCADSRSSTKLIMGHSQNNGRSALRSAGGVWTTKDGKLDWETSLFLALSARRGRPVVHAQHSTCGAMGVAKNYGDGNKEGLGEGFKELGAHFAPLYEEVMGKGQTEKAIIEYYRDQTDIKVDSVEDCFGLQQSLWDYKAAAGAGKGANVILVYQDMRSRQNYVSVDGQKFIPVPTINGLDASPEARIGCVRPDKTTRLSVSLVPGLP